jgi:DNA primase
MISEEIIAKARAVSITDYLATLGIQPVRTSGKSSVYDSPFREEKTASFHVYLDDNRFHDFGDVSKGKNVIDLVQNLHGYSFAEAVELLAGTELTIAPVYSFVGQKSESEAVKQAITQINALQNPSLIKYCGDRAISFGVAAKWFKEVHYTYNEKRYFGVGFQNDLGGYVTRNALMKHPNNIGIAGITTIKSTNTQSLAIFEGYFDYLSAMEHYGCNTPTNTVIILNSVSNLKQAFPLILEATKINLFLDNDTAGRKAMEAIKAIGKTVIDHSTIYAGYNDFNEFLVASRKPP